MTLLMVVLGAGAAKLVHLLRHVSWRDWLGMVVASAGRCRVRCRGDRHAVGAAAGLAIGTSRRLSRLLQPVVQVAASFPAPMLFLAAIAAMQLARVPIGWARSCHAARHPVVRAFNVIAGRSRSPAT